MTGPAYIAAQPVEGSPELVLHTPTCDEHPKRWHGPSTFIKDGAQINVTVHNTDEHSRERA